MSAQQGRHERRWNPRGLVVVLLAAAVVVAACSSDSKSNANSVTAAQARVDSAQTAVTDAQKSLTDANAAFCTETKDYIEAIDRYGQLFVQSAATVGDVTTQGADLETPRASVETAVTNVKDAQSALAAAEKELVDAQNALAVAAASASSAPPPSSSATTSTTTTTVPTATVDRVKRAESDLADASKSITEQTPLTQATATYNSAAFALEIAWLQLFAEAGCLTDEQEAKAVAAVQDYTVALQTDLTTAGYYTGAIDGVYGPDTVAAVEQLQKDNNLPVTGLVDQATATALDAKVKAVGSATAGAAASQISAVQTTLKLAGYWDGPIDGVWTPELTDALKQFQTALGVPATGAVDAATLAALEKAIADAQTASSTTTTTTAPQPTTTSSSG